MSNILKYKEYVGVFEYYPDDHEFHGRVMGLRDVVHFSGTSVEELEQSLADSVEDYIEFCRETGKEPEKPYSGKFVVRISPEVHRLADQAAKATGKSLNAFAAQALENAAREAGVTD